jgi:cytochrome c-type biogenesis protein CcmH
MIWVVFALVTFAALAVVLYPLLRPAAAIPARADYDLAVYRAQLNEVEADAERGVLAPDQASDVRLEIQRRMLEAARASGTSSSDDRRARRMAGIVIAVILPLGAGLLYAAYGHPELPDRPYAARLEHDPAVILAHAAEDMERDLAAKPSARGYQRLSRLYLDQRDYEHAAGAIKRAIALGANDAADWAELGQIYVLAADGAVPPIALAAFARALELDAREPRARFFAGVAESQIGNLQRAVAIWRDLERDSKPAAPWLPILKREIAETAKAGKFDPASIAPEPPSAAALAAAVERMNKAMR